VPGFVAFAEIVRDGPFCSA